MSVGDIYLYQNVGGRVPLVPLIIAAPATRHNTALTDNLKHTQAVPNADRVRCLALVDHSNTNSLYNS